MRSYRRPRRAARGRRLGARARPRSPRHAPRVAEEAVALLSAPPCPEGDTTSSCTASRWPCRSTSRSATRSSSTGSSAARPPTPARAGSAPGDFGSLRYGSDQLNDHRRRDAAGGLGSFGWDDEGVAARAYAADRRAACCAARCPTASRRRRSASALGRLRARRGLRAPADRAMTNVSLEPGRRRLRSRTWSPTPMRACTWRRTARGRSTTAGCSSSSPPRSRARSAAASSAGCPQPLLRRDHAALLGRARRRRRAGGLASVGPDQLRQGRAGPGHGRVPRRRAGALSRRPGRGGVTAAGERRSSWPSVRYAGGRRRAGTVVREHSLLSRFARSRPTQATAVDDTSVSAVRVRDGHAGAAETNDLTDDGLRDRAAAPRRRPRGGRAAGGPGDYPGLPAPRPCAATRGSTRRPRALDPAQAGAGARGGVRGLRRARARGVRRLDRRRRRDRDRLVDGLRARDQVTDAYLKVIARDERRSHGLGGDPGRRRPARSTRGAGAPRRGEGHAEEPVELGPGEYPVVLEPEAVGALLEFLGWLAFNGLAHAEGRGALTGAWARGSPRRRSTSATRRASRARCRGPSTPRASRRRRCR